MKICLLAGIASLLLCEAKAQLPVPRNIQPAWLKGTRTTDGRPGLRYWQNRADYAIDVHFTPATRKVSGAEEITYFNNSTDTLKQVVFKLYPNLYRKGAERDAKILPQDVTDGVNITRLLVNGEDRTKAIRVEGTNMTVRTPALKPGDTLHFTVDFIYTLNERSHNRTGQVDTGAHFVAYFFPRIAVYDDIDGWNRIPYTGTQEFYNDFCRFKAAVTVPAGYVVWATGTLKNATEVLAKPICDRLAAAEKSDTAIEIIRHQDIADNAVTAARENTWHFEADEVTDFVFATSNHYIWKACSVEVDAATRRRTRVDVAFNPQHKDFYEVIDYSRKTVEAMSYVFPKWPFPYEHETIFDGLDQMEYPMMVNDNPLDSKEATIELTDHEIFHTMFPFYMGTNETKYAWMDEGWATLGEWLISPMIDSTIKDDYGIGPYSMDGGTEQDMPVVTPSNLIKGTPYFLNAYAKPAMGYLYVKEMLGDSLFLQALHYYIKQWHGKHPIPQDFFNCMNTGAGRNMDWFWKRWFFDNGYADLTVNKVTQKKDKVTITVTNTGGKPVPVSATVYLADGSTRTVQRDISVWEKQQVVNMAFAEKQKVTKVVLGGLHVPDSQPADNTFTLP